MLIIILKALTSQSVRDLEFLSKIFRHSKIILGYSNPAFTADSADSIHSAMIPQRQKRMQMSFHERKEYSWPEKTLNHAWNLVAEKDSISSLR